MEPIFSKELESKQLSELITDVYDELYEEYEILIPPDGDHGLFKYIGMSPQAQHVIEKISRKREANRTGLGFVIQRAEFPDRFRLKIDLEISEELTRRNPQLIHESMNTFSFTEFGGQAPEFILYHQPAFSGKRQWSHKTFIGIEMEIQEKEFRNLKRITKRMIDTSRRLFQAVDFALTNT